MPKPILKTLSFSFATLAAAAMLGASEQGPVAERSSASDSARPGCAAPSEVDRGWEKQFALLETRLAERAAKGLAAPGAIITPPFEAFAPYRTDVPAAVAANQQTVRASRRDASEPPARE